VVNWGARDPRVLDDQSPDQRDALLDLVDLRRSIGMAKPWIRIRTGT
jgi:hypothetical protein